MLKRFISIIVVSVMVITLFACAKKEVEISGKTFDTSKTYTIAISQSAERKAFESIRKGFVIGMKNLGFLEDVNVVYKYENANANKSFADQIADAYEKEEGIDLILTIGDISTTAMADKVKDIPIVFAGVGNAERLGLIDSEGMPLTSNVTGVVDSHLIAERLSFINLNYPDVKKLGIIYNADDEMSKYDIDYFKFNATAYDIDIYTVSFKRADQIDMALDEIIPKVDALVLLNDYMVDDNIDKVMEKANAAEIDVFGDSDEHLAHDAIVNSSRDYQLVGEESAKIVSEIIKEGKKPDEIKSINVNFKIN